MLLSSIKSAHAQEIEINFMSCLDLGECSRKGWWKDKFGDVNGQTPLECIFFHFSKHYYATSEVSLFLSVLINKVIKD